jgi:hypothetical protein
VERIIAAAIDHNGKVNIGKRHASIIRDIRLMGDRDVITQDSQGFVTSTGRFVDRATAYVIAKGAGQIIRPATGYQGTNLFSEDLW